jgi:hypothetical protein
VPIVTSKAVLQKLMGAHDGHEVALLVQLRLVLATSFVTSHTSTAFTFYMRCIILFSASQRHRAWDIRWDIRSRNWPVMHDGASFLATAYEMRVQST